MNRHQYNLAIAGIFSISLPEAGRRVTAVLEELEVPASDEISLNLAGEVEAIIARDIRK